jgi:hypothetical protein
LDRDGSVIDGKHPLAADETWPTIKLEHVGCERERLLARLISDVARALLCHTAKTMAVDSSQKIVHKTCAACGDDFCTLERMSTSETEREDFDKASKNWKHVDPRIAKEIDLNGKK